MRERAWIVVPFTNVTRSTDFDWLRDGSVNLLTLDMGRWTDVDVVPDKRVSDLIRESTAARVGVALTLRDGLAVARRAGASRLVMGDFLTTGSGVRLVATVFDVKTGEKVRTVTRHAVNADSLLGAFGPLAREVLAIPAPADAKTGDIGTQSLDAYRAYLLGVKALNRFDLAEARRQLTRALDIDSSFALAHLQFANLLGWADLSGGELAKRHARAAQRLGAALPRREKMLIDAGVASADGDYARLCRVARTLVAQDSTDIQGVFLLGECSFHDDTVVPLPSDSSIGVFQGSWPMAMRSFQRVIELDPAYLGAFEHIIQMLQRQRRQVCVARPVPSCSWTSYVLRTGDTLEIVPVRPSNAAALDRQYERFRAEKSALMNHRQLAAIAQRWVDADPGSEGARYGRARAAMLNGDLIAADSNLRRIPPRPSEDNLAALRLKLEVSAKRGRGVEARAIFDSIVKLVPDDPSVDAQRGAIELAFGRLTRFERGAVAAGARVGPEAAAYQQHVGRALLGLPRDGMRRDEAAFFTSMRDASCDDVCRLDRMAATLLFAPHAPAVEIPPLMAGKYSDAAFGVSRALATRDTGRVRRMAHFLDSVGRGRTADQLLDHRTLLASIAHLQVGDSVSALTAVRFFVDSSMVFMGISSAYISGLTPVPGAALWPRAMLVRADLAAAAGSRDEAKLWYDRVIDLWSDADAELRPVVERIRQSRASLAR